MVPGRSATVDGRNFTFTVAILVIYLGLKLFHHLFDLRQRKTVSTMQATVMQGSCFPTHRSLSGGFLKQIFKFPHVLFKFPFGCKTGESLPQDGCIRLFHRNLFLQVIIVSSRFLSVCRLFVKPRAHNDGQIPSRPLSGRVPSSGRTAGLLHRHP